MLMDKIRTIRKTRPKQLWVMFRYKLHVLLARHANDKNTLLKEWTKYHSKWLLESQKGPNYRWDDQHFERQWSSIFGEFMAFRRNQFNSDDALFDVGCGSRPALDWFEGPVRKYHLDPLLAEFVKIQEVRGFWQGKPEESMLAMPAETPIEWLHDSCSFVNCWNVLDHTYDWKKILENIASYTKAGAFACIGTDFQSHGIGHPGIDNYDSFRWFVEEFFIVEKEEKNLMGRELALNLMRNDRPIVGVKLSWG